MRLKVHMMALGSPRYRQLRGYLDAQGRAQLRAWDHTMHTPETSYEGHLQPIVYNRLTSLRMAEEYCGFFSKLWVVSCARSTPFPHLNITLLALCIVHNSCFLSNAFETHSIGNTNELDQ